MGGLLYFFTVDCSYVTPQLKLFYFNKCGIAIPYIGKFSFEFHSINNIVYETLFTMQQWNLLWFLPLPAILIYILKQRKLRPFISGILLTCLTLSFLIISFYFTELYLLAINFTLINRAILYVVPLIIFALSTHFLIENETDKS